MPLDALGKEPVDDMDTSFDEEPKEPLDEFGTEVSSAFPAEDWTPERLMALKEAIKICVAADTEGEYDKPPPKKGGLDLALVFPGGPKKKSG